MGAVATHVHLRLGAYHELGRLEEALALARRLRQDVPGEGLAVVYEGTARPTITALSPVTTTLSRICND